MIQEDKLAQKRFVAFSEPFHKKIKELGFVLKNRNSKQLTFEKEDKVITSSFDGILLIIKKDGKEISRYKGLTIGEEMLEFFSKRDLPIINQNDKTSL